MRAAVPRVNQLKREGHFKEALESIASLRPDIDKFFEQVMVMAENEAVKKNRLALLSELLREFTTIADFSEMGGEVRS
jgi:glycyl-tRNA synthetase beta chain